MSDIEDKLERGLNPGGGRRGGKRGGREGGGGGRGENREVLISKALSRLLRHAATDAGLQLDAEGYARVDQVMQWPRLKSLQVTFQDIQTAVTDNEKQRFSMKARPSLDAPDSSSRSEWLIRANQGHSIASISSAGLLTPITLAANNVPGTVIHGTYFGFYEEILRSGGLRKMGRNHVHFSTGVPGEDEGVKSGMRGDAEVLIYVDVESSLRDEALKWWISENGVVLTEGNEEGLVPTRYWKKVVGRKLDVGVLWEDGKMVKELPENVRGIKPPMGKGRAGQGKGKGAERGGGRGRGRGRGKGRGHENGGPDDLETGEAAGSSGPRET